MKQKVLALEEAVNQAIKCCEDVEAEYTVLEATRIELAIQTSGMCIQNIFVFSPPATWTFKFPIPHSHSLPHPLPRPPPQPRRSSLMVSRAACQGGPRQLQVQLGCPIACCPHPDGSPFAFTLRS